MSTARPPRLRVTDELGRVRTLDAGPESFVRLAAAAHGPLLVLGVGPNPTLLPHSAQKIFWLDCPDFLKQMPTGWTVPPHWQRIAPAELGPLAAQAEIWQYRAAPKLFPSFWGPVLGALAVARLPHPPARSPETADPVVILPRTTLLHRELAEAFGIRGLRVAAIDSDPAKAAAATLDILKNETVALFLSLNFEGLDAGGELFHLLRARNIPVAAWLADNPWHLLSRIQQPWWRGVRLYVTDPSFVAPLRAHGAENVSFLPLAAWDMPVALHSASGTPRGASLNAPFSTSGLSSLPPTPPAFITFAGHSSFPQRDRFFSGLSLPAPLLDEAFSLLDTPTPPDLLWWQNRLHIQSMWPGPDCRLPGFGAERVSLERRTRFLQACVPLGLTLYGDAGWASRLQADLRPPVDYYTALGSVYAHSRYILNVTSLQLPQGLTQRHFDVWQAGGFLLTDRSPGLSLFPAELTAPISAARPDALPALIADLEKDSALRRDLALAWQTEIRNRHTYAHRIERLL